ncbi:hypothetical protein GCM10027047_27530 [Rhodococcus aerolatus]
MAPTRADLDGALRKAASVWLRTPGHGDRLVWAVWPGRGPLAGRLLVAAGGAEQAVPGLAEGVAVVVTVAAAGSRSALGAVRSEARALAGAERDAAEELLRAARRNAAPAWQDVWALDLLAGAAGSAGGGGLAPR